MADDLVPSWEEVARLYGRKIYNFAYRLTGNPDDAADLVQEVLLRVRKGLAGYTPGSFEGWLWRITRNAFLDSVRKKKRRPESPLPDADRSTLATSPSPDVVLASVRLSETVQAATAMPEGRVEQLVGPIAERLRGVDIAAHQYSPICHDC